MRVPRLMGYGLVFGGMAMLAFASVRVAHGSWRQQEARRAWEEAEARSVVALARRATDTEEFPAGAVLPGAPVARLLIPRLGLDEIVIEGVDDDALNAGPGHLPGSAIPGAPGNAIISAHRDRHFARLGEIGVGDTVVTESRMHRRRWVVVSKRVVLANAPALFRSSGPTLTLTTCWPIRYVGTAPERLLVSAKPIDALKPGSFASAGRT